MTRSRLHIHPRFARLLRQLFPFYCRPSADQLKPHHRPDRHAVSRDSGAHYCQRIASVVPRPALAPVGKRVRNLVCAADPAHYRNNVAHVAAYDVDTTIFHALDGAR